MIFLHVQLEDGETAHIYLWEEITSSFRCSWNEMVKKLVVVLITTLNAKTLGAQLLPLGFFFDLDIPETKSYLERFGEIKGSPIDVNNSFLAVAKPEVVSLDEIHKFLANETPQVPVETTVTDVEGGVATFVLFDKEVSKLVSRLAPDLMGEVQDEEGMTPACVNFSASRQTITVLRILEDNIGDGSEGILKLTTEIDELGENLRSKEKRPRYT